MARDEVAQAKPGAITLSPSEARRLAPNERAVCRFFNEAISEGNYEVLGEILSTDAVLHHVTSPEPIRGLEAIKRMVTAFRTAFPDLSATVAECVVHGDKISARVECLGTHQGTWMNVKPTGKKVCWSVQNLFHLKDGKITDLYSNEDTLGILRQLGVTNLQAATGVYSP